MNLRLNVFVAPIRSSPPTAPGVLLQRCEAEIDFMQRICRESEKDLPASVSAT
jgi:hypothetical protein